jgi:hypothetical protein
MAAFPGNILALDYPTVRVDESPTTDREGCRGDGPTPERVSATRAEAALRDARSVVARARDNEHVRRAIQVMLRGLEWLPNTDEVSQLREQGESLLADVARWTIETPSPQVRESAMRRVASMHLSAVSAMRAARERR